jgi:hypothetical protein
MWAGPFSTIATFRKSEHTTWRAAAFEGPFSTIRFSANFTSGGSSLILPVAASALPEFDCGDAFVRQAVTFALYLGRNPFRKRCDLVPAWK